jgi:IclR family pca regulon transcriptional regulator
MRSPPVDDVPDRELMAGLEKGLAAIEAFEHGKSTLTVTEVAARTGLSRAAARRCMRTLVRLRYAGTDGKYYWLAPRTLRLGHAYVSSNELTRLVQPIIEATSERTHNSMSVAVLDRPDVVIIARAVVRRSLSTGLGIGTRLPCHCSANGRVLLSGLPDGEAEAILRGMPLGRLTAHTKTSPADILKEIRLVRSRGYAINDQEVELGLRTIAVPLHRRSGETIASLSMSAPVGKAERKDLIKLLPEIESTRLRLRTLL